jgi:hypothetical protein
MSQSLRVSVFSNSSSNDASMPCGGKVETTISILDPYPHPTETSIVSTKNTQN